MSLRFFTYAERPELEVKSELIDRAWPAFMEQDPVMNRCFGLLYERFPAFQHFLVDEETGELVAEVNSLPCRLVPEQLPDRGVDEAVERGTEVGETPTLVCAVQVVIHPSFQGRGLSRDCLERMCERARRAGYLDLVAPVRPSWKDRYPLLDARRYAAWTRDDGLPFDPWLRVHARLGAKVVRVCPESMTIPGTVGEWSDWTGMAFPESGPYVVPGALVPVEIDLEAGTGLYVEPNVWMHHRL